MQVAVTLKDTGWTVSRHGVAVGRGMKRSHAVELAVQIAFEAEEAGEDVNLFIQGHAVGQHARALGDSEGVADWLG